MNDYKRLNEIRTELQQMLEREHKRHMMDSDSYLVTCLEEVLGALDEYLDYEPSDAELGGEPPITAAEMHATAWRQHQELHR